jgi:hypothetical protein
VVLGKVKMVVEILGDNGERVLRMGERRSGSPVDWRAGIFV